MADAKRSYCRLHTPRETDGHEPSFGQGIPKRSKNNLASGYNNFVLPIWSFLKVE